MKCINYYICILILVFTNIQLFAKEGFKKISTPVTSNIKLLDFNNVNFGVVISEKNELYVTLDGGVNFLNKTKMLPKLDSQIYDLKIIKSNEIYITSEKKILVSCDSCTTWSKFNNIDINNNNLSCSEFNKFDSICYCYSKGSTYYSNNNGVVWSIINNDSYFKSFEIEETSKFILLDYNKYVILFTQIMLNTTHYDYSLKYYINNNLETNNRYFSSRMGIYGAIGSPIVYNNFLLLDNNSILLGTLDGIYISNDNCLTWQKYFGNIDSNFVVQNINDSSLYLFGSHAQFGKLVNKNYYKCKIGDSVNGEFVRKVKVINEKVAFALLWNSYDTTNVTNYFLKTEDGGGVDLSDVEKEEITNPQIEYSTDLQLFDLLGRQIATYDNYYKLKTEIANFTPPHLIKWRDASGVYHFEKFK